MRLVRALSLDSVGKMRHAASIERCSHQTLEDIGQLTLFLRAHSYPACKPMWHLPSKAVRFSHMILNYSAVIGGAAH